MKHTPTPWEWKQTRGNNNYEHRIFTQHQTIAEMDGDNSDNVRANARLIVRSVNNHDRLAGMLDALAAWLETGDMANKDIVIDQIKAALEAAKEV
jgi:hypothetical protein